MSPGVETMVGSEARTEFYDLYHREAPGVLRFLRASVGDLATAEDLCADAFCSAWDRWGSFRGGPGEARAWVFRIARNRLIDHLRRDRRVRLVAPDEALPARPGADTEMGMDLRRALAELGAEEREVLGLRTAGLSHAEIGRVQGRSEEAVKKSWQRALVRLRGRLEVES